MNPVLYLGLTAVTALFQLGFIFAGAFVAAVGWNFGKKLVS